MLLHLVNRLIRFILYLQLTNNSMDQFQDNNFKNKIYLKKN